MGSVISTGGEGVVEAEQRSAVHSGSAPGLGIVYSKPEGEPAVPAIIFSLFKLD